MFKALKTPSVARQVWLEQATHDLRPVFAAEGYTVPANIRVSIGWPKGSRGSKRAIGQCWDKSAVTDDHAEIFISPELGRKTAGEGVRILGVLAHEMAHAILGTKAGHKSAFKKCAYSIGLEGKPTATTEGEKFKAWARPWLERNGEFPGGAINTSSKPKQTTRLIKCECGECGYIVRTTEKWLEERGAPHCGTLSHGRMAA